MISKQKEIFNTLADERLEEITRLERKFQHNNLIYRCKVSTADVKFNDFDSALNLIDKIREGKISLTDAKSDQIGFK